ncbi:Hypothetical protein R9X50_00412800 [Acrodontium crateriforme]|uniref:Beta-lactamase-related domain-containing protein n=1 Tax=Acrodontium crateriforme TaxID=150365 RepID=A0AAQ3RAH7_9PEZI|nr:Hypothetical protein R9X50_00412800 [Acrodontium crateriforme]
MEAQLDPIFQAAVDSKKTPGVAAVALDATGKVLFSKGYGHTLIDPESPAVTVDSPLRIFSCTKLLTTIAALQLVEQGKLDIMTNVEEYLPEISKIQLLRGFNEDGSPDLAAPTKKPTILNLMTHTSGFSYDFFDKKTKQYRKAMGQPSTFEGPHNGMEQYTTPFVLEPGSGYIYGVSTDWLGFVIQKVSGLPLATYIEQNILMPLDMKNSGVDMSHENWEKFMVIHAKDPAGNLAALPPMMFKNSDLIGGGGYLFTTANDYSQLLLTVLNGGTHPLTKVVLLQEGTVKNFLFTDMIPTVGCSPKGIGEVTVATPMASREGTILPGVEKGHSCGLLLANSPVPNGRSKGSGSWAGLSNSYYWIDPAAGKLGLIVNAVIPWMDKDLLHLADALERAVYDKPAAKEVGEPGSNFSGGNYKIDV